MPTIADEVVGFAHVGPVRQEPVGDESGTPVDDDVTKGVGEVYGFYLHPRAWGSGAAAALIAECHGYLCSSGFTTAVLWVLRDNPRARAFYERSGWAWSGATGEWSPPREDPVAEVEYTRTV